MQGFILDLELAAHTYQPPEENFPHISADLRSTEIFMLGYARDHQVCEFLIVMNQMFNNVRKVAADFVGIGEGVVCLYLHLSSDRFRPIGKVSPKVPSGGLSLGSDAHSFVEFSFRRVNWFFRSLADNPIPPGSFLHIYSVIF